MTPKKHTQRENITIDFNIEQIVLPQKCQITKLNIYFPIYTFATF